MLGVYFGEKRRRDSHYEPAAPFRSAGFFVDYWGGRPLEMLVAGSL